VRRKSVLIVRRTVHYCASLQLQRRHITPNGVYFANRTMPAFVLPDPVEA
jgi:hypothetical protein